MTESLLVQLRLPAGAPATLEAAADHLGLEAALLDTVFGIVPTDAADRLYCVKVQKSATTHLNRRFGHPSADPAEGVFADVQIAPFGPMNGEPA